MTPGARLLSVVEIIDDIFINNSYASEISLKNWLRRNRYAGSTDKKEIRKYIYGIIKRYFTLEYIQKHNQFLNNFSLEITIIYYIFHVCGKEELISYFDDGPYAIKITPDISKFISKINSFSLSDTDYIKNSLPEWLFNEFYKSYPDNIHKVCESLFNEAHFDVRIKKNISRKNIIKKLKNYNIISDITPISPIGIRVNKRISISHLQEFNKGLIEVQDEGSQLVSLLCGAKEHETIVDLCAGAGGKSLAIADLLENVKIIATDINLVRLEKIYERAKRLKVIDKIFIENNYANMNIKADRVICDVPCSGSGAWRRRPEEKLNLTEKGFQNLLNTQKTILDYAATLLKIGGELVYITCSILNKENQNQINSFIKNNSNFKIVDLQNSWESITNSYEWYGKGECCQLLPSVHECDGFFIARLVKLK